MLNYNSPINKEIKHNDISIKEFSPIMKLNLRGKKREFFTAVGKHLDMILPTEANTSSSSYKLTSIWLSPDEWMIISNEITKKNTNKYDVEQSLYNDISKTMFGSSVNNPTNCFRSSLIVSDLYRDLLPIKSYFFLLTIQSI